MWIEQVKPRGDDFVRRFDGMLTLELIEWSIELLPSVEHIVACETVERFKTAELVQGAHDEGRKVG